ncbi:MAG: SGNH hydrolase domain-containing protein [Planctomycetia bacterium]
MPDSHGHAAEGGGRSAYLPVLDALRAIGVSILCAWASYVLVETPLRGRLGRPSAGLITYGAFVVGAIALCTLGYGIRLHYNLNGTVASVRRGGTRYGDGRPVTVLAGDSTACMFATTVRDICQERRSQMVMAAVPAMDPLPLPRDRGESLWSLWEPILSRERPACVVLSAAWTRVLKTAEDRRRLARCVEAMLGDADRVILLIEPPILPVEATRAGIRKGCRPPFREHDDDRKRRLEANGIVRGLASERVRVIDLDRHLLDESGSIRRWDSHGNDLFVDRTHVSAAAANLFAADIRKEMFATPEVVQRDETTSVRPGEPTAVR